MGIPQFFNWLTRKYNEDIICHFENPDHLFFDFNGIVYQCYARLNYDVLIKKSLHERQNHLIYDVIRYTRHVINTANPSKTVGFFMDGPVPMAKMHQQRLRRYKGPIMKEWENDIKKKYGVFKEELLDTNQITPGTLFMNALSDAIQNAIKSNYFGKPVVFLNDANVAGEGEHKIMNHIRATNIPPKESICIYGMDADLIMLSLSLKRRGVMLIRENAHIRENKSGPEFLFVNIEKLSGLIQKEMSAGLTGVPYNVDNLISDYVFLGFFLGNDFLHHIPSLSIQNNGVDFMIGVYSRCFAKIKDHLLLKDGAGRTVINHRFLAEIFEALARSEESNLLFLQKRKRTPKPPNFDDHYAEDKWKWDRVPFNPLFKDCSSVIDYTQKDWKKKYYDVLLEAPDIDEICKNYFDGLVFVVRYYFDGEVCWNWYNPYHYCPFASDLNAHLKRVKDINGITLERGTPFHPFEQLMMVLPKGSASILPKCLETEMKSKELEMYYPATFEWVAWEKFMLYSIEPKLPLISVDAIRAVVARNKKKLDTHAKKQEKDVVKVSKEIVDL